MTKNLDKDGFCSIIDNYQLFYIDLWGVIHNGVKLHKEAINVLKEIQSKLNELENPTEPIVYGAMILFAGALLLTPGFFTDTVGFLLLLPRVRKAAFFWLRNKINLVKYPPSERSSSHKDKHSDIEITDYKEVEPEEKSPWTNNNKTHKGE